MLSGQLPRIPEPRGSDPDWFRQMKIWCTDVVRAIARSRLVADNATLREQNGVLSAIPDFPSMFKVDQTGPESISVRAGVASRYDGTAGTAATYEMTTVGAGTSASPLDGVELTSLAASQWIILTLDESAGTLTATATGNLTIPTSDDGTVIPVALVIVDGGKITRIFQAHSGPWYLPSPVNPDAKSIDRNDTGELEIKGWKGAQNDSETGITSAMLISVHTEPTGQPVLIYKNFAAMADWLDTPSGEGGGGLYGENNPPPDPPFPEHPHSQHDAFGTDDHCVGRTAVAGDDTYIHANGGAARNAMSSGLGDSSGDMSVDVNGRLLKDSGGTHSLLFSGSREFYNGWRFKGSGIGSSDEASGILDDSGSASVMPNTRKLHKSDGATAHLDWELKELLTDWAAKANLTVDLRATVNDLTVTQPEVTVGGQIYTTLQFLAVDPADNKTYQYEALARKVAPT